jgi:two-component system, NarL family, sensor histidine kinase FusK
MSKGIWSNEWLKQIAVAVGFALVYVVEHPFSQSQFIIASGIRLVFLMLLPYRYWPALAVGEFFPEAYLYIPCLPDFGASWVMWRCIPPIIFGMPLVWLFRRYGQLFPSRRTVDVKALLGCVLTSSAAWTVYSFVALLLVKMPPGKTFTPQPIMAAGYMTGNYLGILAVVPLALIVRFDYSVGGFQRMWSRVLRSRITLDTLGLLLPTAVALALISVKAGAEMREMVLMGLFLPVSWLTLKHGWRAAAIGGALAVACAGLLLPTKATSEVLITEMFLAVTITTLYALGARITTQVLAEQGETMDIRNAQRVARQSFQLGERRLRHAATSLTHIADTLLISNSKIMESFRKINPGIENHGVYRQAMTSHEQLQRLAENLHPVAWRDRGLPAALNETIASALEDAGITYRMEMSGRGFSRASSTVLTAAYRLICEAVVYASTRTPSTSIRVVLRGGESRGKPWLYLSVDGTTAENSLANAVVKNNVRQQLAGRLGALGMDAAEMRDQARIFEGDLRSQWKNGVHLCAILHDITIETRKPFRATPRLRLVVS